MANRTLAYKLVRGGELNTSQQKQQLLTDDSMALLTSLAQYKKFSSSRPFLFDDWLFLNNQH